MNFQNQIKIGTWFNSLKTKSLQNQAKEVIALYEAMKQTHNHYGFDHFFEADSHIQHLENEPDIISRYDLEQAIYWIENDLYMANEKGDITQFVNENF